MSKRHAWLNAEPKRMTDEEISLAVQAVSDVLPLGHTEWEFEAAFARAIEAATERRVRREIAEYVRTHRTVYHSIAPHHTAEKVEPDISSKTLAAAIESGGSQ